MSREGQGFSLSLIVIAAIALVVMVIIIALTTASGGDVFRGTQSCESLGTNSYTCVGEFAACPTGYAELSSRTCDTDVQPGPKCCQSLS